MKRYLLLILTIALAACAKSVQDGPTPTPAVVTHDTPTAVLDDEVLQRYHWKLTDAVSGRGDAKLEALFPSKDKPLQLDFSDGRLGVSGACNRIGGSYSVKDGKLVVTSLMRTQMACADAKLMQAEQAISAELAQPLNARIESGAVPTLILQTDMRDGHMLTFTGEPTAETRYGGPGETTFLEVAAQTKPCSHPLIPSKQCLQVREIEYDDKGIKTTTGEWQNFYQGIEGYAREPGIRNVLRVKRFTIKNPPADGSSIAYELDMVVESETVSPL